MRGYVALLLALFVAWPLLPAPAVGIQPGGMYGGTVTVALASVVLPDASVAR